MATRTVKSDSGNDLKLQNNGGTGSVTITDAGDLTIDSPADIVLDAEGADITLKDGGTAFGTLKQASGHLVIQPESSKEIILNDQAGTAALTVDTANQNVSINNGNLVIGTAGKGIDFAAASGTTEGISGEVLEHVETGNWTPVVSLGVTSPVYTSGGKQEGKYSKVGNLITCSCTLKISSAAATTGSTFRVGGFPFNALTTTDEAFFCIMRPNSIAANGENSYFFMNSGADTAYVNVITSTGGAGFSGNDFGSTGSISFTMTYITD